MDPLGARAPRRASLRLNAVASVAGNLSFFAALFLLTPLAIRELGAEAWGIWQIVGAITAYATLLNLGLGTTIHQEVAYQSTRGDWERLSRAFTNLRLYLTAAGALLLLLLWLGGDAFVRSLVSPEHAEMARGALSVSVVITALTLPLRIFPSALAGLQRLDLYGVLQVVAAVAMVAAVWLGFRRGMGLVGFACVMTVASVLSALPSWLLVRRLLPRASLRWSRFDARLFAQMIRYSLSTLVYTMGTVVLYQTMRFVASWRCGGAEAAGYMGLAVTLVQSLGVVFVPVVNPLLSRSAQLHAEGRPEAIRDLLGRSLVATGLLLVPCLAFLAQSTPAVLEAWLGSSVGGEPLAQIGRTVRLMLIGQGAYVLSLPCYYVLLGTGEHRIFGVGMLIAALSNAALGFGAAGLFPRIETLGLVFGACTLALSAAAILPAALRGLSVPLGPALRGGLLVPLLAVSPGIAGVGWRPRLGLPIMDLVLDAILFTLLAAPGLELARRRLLGGGSSAGRS
jgi:O-antigen/teichoic acid export membrane protein